MPDMPTLGAGDRIGAAVAAAGAAAMASMFAVYLAGFWVPMEPWVTVLVGMLVFSTGTVAASCRQSLAIDTVGIRWQRLVGSRAITWDQVRAVTAHSGDRSPLRRRPPRGVVLTLSDGSAVQVPFTSFNPGRVFGHLRASCPRHHRVTFHD